MSLPTSVIDELMIGARLSPFVVANLRCKVRSIISCSDASERGGAAAEASRFSAALSPEVCTFADGWKSSLAEESSNIHTHKSKDTLFVHSVVEHLLLLKVVFFAQENVETCPVLLDVCKFIATKIVALRVQVL